MSAYDLKPKWLPDEKVIATKLGWEHKDTGEVLVSFASVGGLPSAKDSVFMQRHHLEMPKAVTPVPTGELLSSITPEETLRGTTNQQSGAAGSTDITEGTLNKVGEILNPSQNSPQTPAASSESSSSATQPAASSEQSQPQPQTSNLIKFTFRGVESSANEIASTGSPTVKLKSLLNAPRSGDPEGWTGPFGEEDGHGIMRARGSDDKGFRYIETEGFESDGSQKVTLVFPFKMAKGGTNSSAFAISAFKERNPVNPSVLITNGDDGFKIRSYETLKVNGEAITATKVYPYDKWHVVEMTINTGSENAFDRVRIGTNQNGNTMRNITIGEGTEFIVGDLSQEAQERIKSLITTYVQ